VKSIAGLRTLLSSDNERFRHGLPKALEDYILDAYGISLESSYGGHLIRNPFGKASGQLSLNNQQVEHDVEAGLGFVVLKTLIAEDESGGQSMKAWAIPEARMKVERIVAKRPDATDAEGWTVTWKGRGWSGSLEDYIEFFDHSLTTTSSTRTLVVPSCKYHLPQPGESIWRETEYNYTTQRLLATWQKHRSDAMPIEKDFSPTLAGDANFSSVKETIREWLKEVPRLIRAAAGKENISVGLKIFNAQFEDDFQVELLRASDIADAEYRADYLIYGNRLFDPSKEFEGKVGVAYGGPDLSARNLKILSQYRPQLPFSATGNITSGSEALEYLKCGATSFQMHTLFQLPDTEFAMTTGSRTVRALHRLLFHPEHGFITAILDLAELESIILPVTIPSLISFFSLK